MRILPISVKEPDVHQGIAIYESCSLWQLSYQLSTYQELLIMRTPTIGISLVFKIQKTFIVKIILAMRKLINFKLFQYNKYFKDINYAGYTICATKMENSPFSSCYRGQSKGLPLFLNRSELLNYHKEP